MIGPFSAWPSFVLELCDQDGPRTGQISPRIWIWRDGVWVGCVEWDTLYRTFCVCTGVDQTVIVQPTMGCSRLR